MKENRRSTDQNLINRMTDNVYFRFAHQALTLLIPFVIAALISTFNTYTNKLDHIQDLLTSKVATYDEHFASTDQRLTRLEIKSDYPQGRITR